MGKNYTLEEQLQAIQKKMLVPRSDDDEEEARRQQEIRDEIEKIRKSVTKKIPQ